MGIARPRASCRRCRGESGASMVEFALVLPLFFALVLAMLTGGMTYNRKLQLTHAARETSRYAATLPMTLPNVTNIDDWLTRVRDAAISTAVGDLASSSDRYICVAYVHPNPAAGEQQTKRLVTSGTSDAGTLSSTSCYTDGLAPTERRVQVQVQRDAEFQAFFFTLHPRLDAKATSRYEQA